MVCLVMQQGTMSRVALITGASTGSAGRVSYELPVVHHLGRLGRKICHWIVQMSLFVFFEGDFLSVGGQRMHLGPLAVSCLASGRATTSISSSDSWSDFLGSAGSTHLAGEVGLER